MDPSCSFSWTATVVAALLIERAEGQDARFRVGASAGRVDTNHSIFFRAERADTGRVDGERGRKNRVPT